MKRELRRFNQSEASWLGGVCAGVAYALGIPTWIVRIIWFLFIVAGSGFGLVIYVLLWIFLPEWEKVPDDYKEICGE